MLKYFLLLLGCCCVLKLSAQESSGKIHEVGIRITGLNSGFGAIYNMGNQNIVWRNRLFRLEGSQKLDRDSLAQQASFNAGLATGIEFRKGSEFQFRYGMEVVYNYGYTHSQTTYTDINIHYIDRSRYSYKHQIGLNFVLGVNYVLNEKWTFGLEILPGIGANFNTDRELDSLTNEEIYLYKDSNLQYGLNSGSAALSVAYRFGL